MFIVLEKLNIVGSNDGDFGMLSMHAA